MILYYEFSCFISATQVLYSSFVVQRWQCNLKGHISIHVQSHVGNCTPPVCCSTNKNSTKELICYYKLQ